MTVKNEKTNLYSETNISLKINIDSKQTTFMYQLRVRRGPHDHFLGLLLFELVSNTW